LSKELTDTYRSENPTTVWWQNDACLHPPKNPQQGNDSAASPSPVRTCTIKAHSETSKRTRKTTLDALETLSCTQKDTDVKKVASSKPHIANAKASSSQHNSADTIEALKRLAFACPPVYKVSDTS
jgi:hypothetical protein